MVIVEKQAKGAGKNAHHYARSLANYMETAKRGMMAEEYGLTLATYMRKDANRAINTAPPERVLATGGRVSDNRVSWDAALAELHARMAKRSSRSKKPARHAVVSLHEGEEPDADGCDDIARVLADELGCKEGAILWALHGDTAHRHLHVLILTLDENGAATAFGPQGRSYEAMQRAIARIEHGQGFERESGARYDVVDGAVRLTTPAPTVTKPRAAIRTEVLQWEAKTGVESFTRYAQTQLAPLLEQAASWDEAQAALAPSGAKVMKTGSGGEIRNADGSEHVKLSNVDRKLSWKELTRRWGAWSEPTTEPAPYLPRILDPERATRWAKRDEQAEAVHCGVQARIDRLKAERRAGLDRVRREHDAHRADLSALEGEPHDVARLRQGLGEIYSRQTAALNADYRSRIAGLREQRGEIADTETFDAVELDEIGGIDSSIAVAWGTRSVEQPRPTDFKPIQVGEATQYWREDGTGRGPAFVERGDRIWINDTSDDSVRTALRVAMSRYGVVAAHGDAMFIAQARRLGRELGIEVQDGIAVETPPPRRRSVRAQRRRDAVKQGQAIAATRHDDHSRMRGWSGIDMPEPERRALYARVTRLLTKEDWDPRDYRGGRSRGRDISRSGNLVETTKQVELDRAGQAMAFGGQTGGAER